MNAQKQLSAKKAWSKLNERARPGEKFGKIAMVGLMFKSGFLSKPETVKLLNEAGVTRQDLQKFREQREA